MFYPQQSPGISHKLANGHHDQNAWNRQQQHVGPPPTSPGYAIYTNGNLSSMHHGHPHALSGHHPGMHHQHSTLSHYPPEPNGQSHQHVIQGSPGTAPNYPAHWSQQLLKYESVRLSRSPHHRARASAIASRTVTKSAIAITNPNPVKPVQELASPEPETPGRMAQHPSSTVAPIADASRPTANTWSSLDMGGMAIKNIPPTSGLFTFTFLINLYLNHNALSVVPPEICKLRHLELLDLSGNKLSQLPAELGMLTRLKELYLFDNQITTLPPELGTLHQLQTMGIEGNPLDASLKSIITAEGTPTLVSYLRDSCPVPTPPPERTWVQMVTPAERDTMKEDSSTETFSILSYNILSEKYATEKMYGYTPSWALAWDYRKELIFTEIINYEADFLCLQEVDIAQYEEYFVKLLAERGYEGVIWPKGRYKTMSDVDRRQVDGCATFYKTSKYQLVEKQLIEFNAVAMQRSDFKKTDDMFNRVLGKDHIATVCLLENKETGTRFVIANTHLHWDPAFCDVKLVQAALLMDEIDKVVANFAKYPPRLSTPASDVPSPVYSDGTKIPLIVCGDFNSVPVSGVYEYLSNGSVPGNHADFKSHLYGKYTSDGLKHKLGLKSAYAGMGEMPMTNYTPSFQGAVSYIWYTTANLSVNAVLGAVDKGYLDKVVGFPNAHFPSDHVCILSEFRVKPPRNTTIRSTPVFH